MIFNIVINTDDNYIQHTMATLCSLYENNREHEIVLHVLQKELSNKAINYLEAISSRYDNKAIFYTVNDNLLKGVQFRKNRPLSMAAYYRLLLSSILPKDLEKVLYLDCDMIVMRDISEIFNIELDDYALAATLDSFPYTNKHRLQLHMEVGERTFCSGIMLVNLKYWREHNVEKGLLEYAKRKREEVYLHDQDVLNYYFKKKWFLLPPKWNHIAGSLRCRPKLDIYKEFDLKEFALEPMLYHFASWNIKPWYAIPTPEKTIYKKYLKKSNYPTPIFERKPLKCFLRMLLVTLIYNTKKRLVRFFY